jgi:hypothetical protein
MTSTGGMSNNGNVETEIEWFISWKEPSFTVVTAVSEGYYNNTLMCIVPLRALYFLPPLPSALLPEQNSALKLCLVKEKKIFQFGFINVLIHHLFFVICEWKTLR